MTIRLNVVFIFSFFVFFSGCNNSTPSSPNEQKPGTIRLSVSGVPQFNNHAVWYSIWDSCDAITGKPLGEAQGVGYFQVQNGTGSSLCLSADAKGVKSFQPGKYFPFYFADMNDNFLAINTADSGDYVGGGSNYAIVVDGDVEKRLTGEDFFGPYSN